MERKKILLAEDEEDNRDLVQFVMDRSRMNIELSVATDGQMAVDMAREIIPDLILMDMNMPVMDGLTAVKILKGETRTKHIPIIAFTAQAHPEERKRTLESGCVEHYSKPMDPEELLSTIKKYLYDSTEIQ